MADTEPAQPVPAGGGSVTWPPRGRRNGVTLRHVMTHLSITEGGATWGDHVTDAEYHGRA